MSKEKRKKKRIRKKRIRTFFIAFVFIYLIFRSVPILYASTLKTAIVEEGVLEDKVQLKGVIIRDEKVYSSEGKGKVKLYKKEGERIKSGTKVAKVSLLNDEASLKDELEEVNKKIGSIEKIKKEKSIIKPDKDKADRNTNEVLDDIQDSIAYESFEEVQDLKEELYLSLEKQENLSGENTLAGKTLENLKKKKEKIEKKISNSNIDYFSKEPGIVSYKADGLENIYSLKNILNYDVDDMEEIEENVKNVKDGDKVDIKDTVFKIVDNHNWHLLLKVENLKAISSLNEGDNVNVVLDNNGQKIKGTILKINKKGRQAIIVIKFDSFCHDYYDKRKVNVELIKSNYEGFKIPTKAICKKDNLEGVYIKDISGIIKFKPVKVLGENEEYTIISKGDKNNNIEIEESKNLMKTIKLFDEVLLNSGKIKEGQIVD